METQQHGLHRLILVTRRKILNFCYVPQQWHHEPGLCVDSMHELAGSRQGFAKRKRGGRGVTGGREAPGLGVLLPCASPLYIGVEGAGFLPSKSIGALAKVGGKKSHHFLPHRLLSPLFRDLDLIPSGYDLIPSKGGSWCALTRGVGPCPHYPRSCGSPHAGGPHSGTF